MSPAPIRAIFFDIGNVLVRFEPKAVVRKIAWALRRHPVKLAGIEPGRCLFIDDNRENVAAARKAGMCAIHHTPGHDLRRALREFGLPA